MTPLEINQIYNQSLACLNGQGVAPDEQRAFALNVEAAKGGHNDAVLAMGWFYLNGIGVDYSLELARQWYRESARRGESRAMFSLGQIAYEAKDFEDARLWFTRATQAGHARSLYWLGKLCWRGQGVELNRKLAMKCFTNAAGQKVNEAQRAVRFLGRHAQP